MDKHCSIIIVNWNGGFDTIECMETVLKQDYSNFNIILVDNGSTDGSLDLVKEWAYNDEIVIKTNYPNLVFPGIKRPIEIVEIETETIKNNSFKKYEERNKRQKVIFIIKNDENLGFARANNIAIKFAQKILKSYYIYLLNNDTVIEKETIRNLVNFAINYPEYSVFQSAIYYYSDPNKIWCVGGRILPWAQFKHYEKIISKDFIRSTFITGCAMFVKSSLFSEIGMLSEKFFFGEEDFEFSLRLKREGKEAAVVLSSKVYHKIAQSVENQWENSGEKILNAALNRIINIRDYYSPLKWYIWRFFTIIYYYYLMITLYKIPLIFSLKICFQIFKYSSILESVDRDETKLIINKIL